MKVRLSTQVLSQSMIGVVNDFCASGSTPAAIAERSADYAPVIELLEVMDALVDIMNSKAMNSRGEKKKGLPVIDCGQEADKVIDSLVEILGFFHDWKDEATNPDEFLPEQTWEDLNWLIASNVGLVKFYRKKFPSVFSWSFRSGGSDVIEHHFANVRQSHGRGVPGSVDCKKGADNAMNKRDLRQDSDLDISKGQNSQKRI